MTIPTWLPGWIRKGLILSDFDPDYRDLPATIAVRDPETIRQFRENRARAQAERTAQAEQRRAERRAARAAARSPPPEDAPTPLTCSSATTSVSTPSKTTPSPASTG
jgi:hypothetical protein